MSCDSMSNLKILIIDSDFSIQNLINAQHDLHETMIVKQSTEIARGWDEYLDFKPHLLIINPHLEGGKGKNLLKTIRSSDPLCRIAAVCDETMKCEIEALSEEELSGLRMKPLSSDEICDLIERALKSWDAFLGAYDRYSEEKKRLHLVNLGEGFEFDYEKCELYLKGEFVKLTQFESRVLCKLIEETGKTVHYNQFKNSIWYDKHLSLTSLRTLIKKIRQKTHPDLIECISGVGYRIELPKN